MHWIIIANFSFMLFCLRRYINLYKNESWIVYFLVNFVLYIALFNKLGRGIDFLFLSTITSILVLILFIDLIDMVIPDSLIIVMMGVTIIYNLLKLLLNDLKPNILFHLSGLFIGAFIFILILIISKGGMGQGDVTLISAIGLILGPYYILLNILISFLLGSIVSVFLLLTKLKTHKDPIPFGPFIIIAFFVTIFYGDKLIKWYLSLLY